LIDLIVCPDVVEHTVTENGGKHTITFDRFISDALIQMEKASFDVVTLNG